jgi:pyrroline-5-carboxylate reductase
VFEIARCYVEAAEALGFSPAQARALVLGMMAGAVAMARAQPVSLPDLRTSVTSENGTTEAGLAALNGDGGVSRHISGAVNAAYHRAMEM